MHNCQVCGEPAVVNYELCWVKWEFGNSEILIESGPEEADIYLCGEHAEEFILPKAELVKEAQ